MPFLVAINCFKSHLSSCFPPRVLLPTLTGRQNRRKIAAETVRQAQKAGGILDWKEQLRAILEEAKITFLDVRFICMKQQDKWFLKRLHVTVFHAEPSIPEQVQYPSYLFLRQKMSSSDFLQLLDGLTTHLSAEEAATLSEEEKLKKFSVRMRTIWCGYVSVGFASHIQGNSPWWGILDRGLPSWNFTGSIFPDLSEGQEPLLAQDAPYFPTPIDGQAWYLYEKALQPPNNHLSVLEICLEDGRAFFQQVLIDEKAATVRCLCGGTSLATATLRLYTNVPQIEERPAGPEVMFHFQGEPKVISLALTSQDTWLDRKDTNLNYLQFGVPKGVTVVGRSVPSGREVMAVSTPAIEEIAQADPSDLAAIAGPHLKLVDGYYNNVLRQSRRSFTWAIGGFVGVFVLIAVAILFLIFRLSGETSNLAAIITALGSVPAGLLAGYLLNLHKSASAQAAASQVYLDRIQRFFIANSASENLKEASKDATREALIKKLGDL